MNRVIRGVFAACHTISVGQVETCFHVQLLANNNYPIIT